MTRDPSLPNLINGRSVPALAAETVEVRDPATDEVLGRVPLSGAAEVAAAVEAAGAAFENWREVPAGERIQPLFRLKGLLQEHLDELARSITRENALGSPFSFFHPLWPLSRGQWGA